MERWEIRAAPSADDPDRHMLLMNGGQGDVSALLRRFGGLLGRPTPSDAPGYNLALAVHKLSPESRVKLEQWLAERAPAPAPASDAAPPPAPMIPELPKAGGISLEAAAPSAGGLPPPPPPPLPEIPQVGLPPPAPAPEPAPSLISLTPEPPAPKAPEHAQPPAPDVPAPAAPEAPAAAPPPPPVTPGGRPAPALVPLRADWTFETLLVGAYNRFAHAAATSVVSSPGTMYNPLFLYGVPGTGKSHMLHGIGAALSKGLGDAVLFATSGPRLSRAIRAAVAAKTLPELERSAAGAKALLVDDIHLLVVDDVTREPLAKLFKSFFDRGLQVVITSLFPPRALAPLEEALKFSFSKGWSVDLKIPSPAVQKDLIAAAVERSGAAIPDEEQGLLHEKLSAWGYADLGLWLRRVAVFKKVRAAAGQPAAVSDLLPLMYDPITAGSTEPPTPEQLSAVKFSPPAAPSDAENLIVVAPDKPAGLGLFAAAMLQQVAQSNGTFVPFRIVDWRSFDSSQQTGVPFEIGDLCWSASATRMLLVGPGPDSPLSTRAAELSHAVRRILESFGAKLGWVPYAGLQNAAFYLNASLDLSPDP